MKNNFSQRTFYCPEECTMAVLLAKILNKNSRQNLGVAGSASDLRRTYVRYIEYQKFAPSIHRLNSDEGESRRDHGSAAFIPLYTTHPLQNTLFAHYRREELEERYQCGQGGRQTPTSQAAMNNIHHDRCNPEKVTAFDYETVLACCIIILVMQNDSGSGKWACFFGEFLG